MARAKTEQAPAVGAEIKQGSQVMLNVGMLIRAGNGYAGALKALHQRFGVNISKQSVEVTVVRSFNREDCICCFQHGRIPMQIIVPSTCFTRVSCPDVGRRVTPSKGFNKQNSVSVAAAQRTAATKRA